MGRFSASRGFACVPIHSRIRTLGMVALLGGLGWGFGGCQAGPGGPAYVEGSSTIVTGDWDDVEAAVLVAVPRHELAVVSAHAPDDQTRQWVLVDMRDRQGLLTVQRKSLSAAGDWGPSPLTITCRIGPWGDSEQERALIRTLQDRLMQLDGKDVARPATGLR